MRILFGNGLLRIYHENDNVGVFYRLQGFDYGKFLDCFVDFAAATNPGGVDDGVLLTITFKVNINTIACSAGLVEGNYPFLT